jgi:brefeldin A-inhibited guanine nucleotide-exchange protein
LAYKWIRGTFHDEEDPEHRKLIDKVIDIVVTCAECPGDEVQIQVIKVFATAVTTPVCSVHGQSLSSAVRTCYNIYLKATNHIIQSTAKGTLTQMLNMVFQRLEKQSQDLVRRRRVAREILAELVTKVTEGAGASFASSVKEEENLEKEKEKGDEEPLEVEEPKTPVTRPLAQSQDDEDSAEDSVIYNDSLIIFRALCKLADKELPANVTESSVDARSKVLALELLLSILVKSGPAFRQNEKFINQAIKKWLVKLLVPNGFSPVHRIFCLSLDIFAQLALNFRESLKGEIGLFFEEVLLRLLKTPNSSRKQKLAVVSTLQKICTNPQILVDIFVNYDCNLEGKDIFEDLVMNLSGIAKQNDSVGELQELALKSCVSIMSSLAKWSEQTLEEGCYLDLAGTDREKNADGCSSSGSSSSNISSSSSSSSNNNNNNNSAGSGNDTDNESNSNAPPSDGISAVKERKKAWEDAKKLFAAKPKKGMKLMLAEGMISDPSPEGIARWFHETQGVSMSAMGDFMGEDEPQSIAVMHAYTDQMSFHGLTIDMALRKYMAGFRLPGEGQKIDRFMEKFATKYVTDNPKTIFANADAAFMVAYSVIMLTTDLHRSKKRTQTPETFASMLRGLNDGANFPAEFTLEIYNAIDKNAITVQDQELMQDRANGQLDERDRAELFKNETSMAVQRSVAMLQSPSMVGTASRFVVGENHELVRPMFDRCWAPMLAAFSLPMENSQDPKITMLCLEGFRSCIIVAAIFEMDNQRKTFLNSLLAFTQLEKKRLLQNKNVAAIKILVELAEQDGNLLREGWMEVLLCISKLENSFVASKDTPHRQENEPESLEEGNWGRIVAQIPLDRIDQIFPRSASLDAKSIVHFVQNLVAVSNNEIKQRPASKYSLSKLVEVAAHNMNRVRLVWASIWRVMSDHFTRVGCGKNKDLSHFAVNALKQLAYQFLDKKELQDFNFQKEFLAPFKYILSHSPDLSTRDLVLMCLNNAVELRAPKLQSGWKVVFLCLSEAAKDSNRTLVESGFAVLNNIRGKHFAHVRDSFFVELVSCYAIFAESKFIDVSLQAIATMSKLSHHLCGEETAPIRGQNEVFYTDSEEHIRLWWPILFNLSSLASHSHIDVRTSALDSLFSILNECGGSFSADLWSIIFSGVLRPIFDNARQHTVLSAADNEWLSTTCLKAFQYLVSIFNTFFQRISFLLPEYLELLCGCVLVDGNETLAQYGSTCFLTLVLDNRAHWAADDYTSISRALLHMFRACCSVIVRPVDLNTLFQGKAPEPSARDLELLKRLERESAGVEPAAEEVRELKISVLTMLVRVVSSIVDGVETLSTTDLSVLLDALSFSYVCVRSAKVSNEKLKIGAEFDSVHRILEILGKTQPSDDDRINHVTCDLLNELVGMKDVEDTNLRRQALVPLVLDLLDNITGWADARLRKYLPELFPVLSTLIADHDAGVREKLSVTILRCYQAK